MEKRDRGYLILFGSDSGFTLIEVMTAVTILAIMATIVFGIVFGAVKRSRYIDRRLELTTEAAVVMELILEDLRGAFLREGEDAYFSGIDRYRAEDPSDEVSLLTSSVIPVSPQVPAGGVSEVGYSVAEGENETLVLMRREETPARSPYDDGGVMVEITDRIRSLDLAFSDGQDWYETWDSAGLKDHEAGKLPKQIRVEITLEDGDLSVTHSGSVAPVMAVGR